MPLDQGDGGTGRNAISLLPAYPTSAQDKNSSSTKTPIKQVVVIFQENVSFDHYFGTYPHAKASDNGTVYFGRAKQGTPQVNSLESAGLLTNNPNAAILFASIAETRTPAMKITAMEMSSLLLTAA